MERLINLMVLIFASIIGMGFIDYATYTTFVWWHCLVIIVPYIIIDYINVKKVLDK